MTDEPHGNPDSTARPLTRRELRALRESAVLEAVPAEPAADAADAAHAPGPVPAEAVLAEAVLADGGAGVGEVAPVTIVDEAVTTAAPDHSTEPGAPAIGVQGEPFATITVPGTETPVATAASEVEPETATAPATAGRRRRSRGAVEVPTIPAAPAGLDVDLSAPLVPEPSPSDVLNARAGRNVPVAVGVGLGLVGLLIASLFIQKEAFGLFALVAIGGALFELRSALARQNVTLPVLPLLVGTVGMFVSAYLAGPEALLVAFVLTAGGVFVWCVLDGGGLRVLRNASAAIFVAAYVPFLASFLALALAQEDGAWRVLTVVVLAAACDTGGWAAGVMFGKHALAPTISPKKSWEGLAGSLVLSIAVGALALPLVIDLSWWIGGAIGVLAVLAGLVGDLGESLIKRDLGMKDMSDLLPGHGGVLDRVDSLLVAAPVVVTALALAAP